VGEFLGLTPISLFILSAIAMIPLANSIEGSGGYGAMNGLMFASINSIHRRGIFMSGNADEVKGRAKEAVGVITNDERLKQEGKVDQVSGKIKKATEKVVNKVRDAVKGD
jgi:uncharacterized protein YjbJ (UPF0337 family)